MNCRRLVPRTDKLLLDVVCMLGDSGGVVYTEAKAHLDLEFSAVIMT
jgi:hypothetical protein